MRNPIALSLVVLTTSMATNLGWAEDTNLKLNDIQANQDTTISIKKGSTPNTTEYDIVPGSGEITGAPASGFQESYKNWQTACSEWKSETKELNQGSHILSLNCNTPHVTRLSNGQQSHSSVGTYKVRVKAKGTSPAQ